MSRDADTCPLHLAPSGHGGTIELNHEYREGSKYMQFTNSDEGQMRRIYYCVHCLKEIPA